MNNVKVAIGSKYRPTHFEKRDSHGTYESLRPAVSADGSRLQGALLGPRRSVLGAIRSALVSRT